MPLTPKQNLIKQQYLSSKTDHVICIDITELGTSYGYAFAVIDLAARNIVGHCYKERPLDVQNIIDYLSATIQQRRESFLPCRRIRIIHSDRGESLGSENDQYYYLPNQHQIKEISRKTREGRRNNRVMERTFRTLKKILKRQLQPDWTPKEETDPLNQKGFGIKQIDSALEKAIEIYNNKPHKALYLITPNQMEKALFQQSQEAEEEEEAETHTDQQPEGSGKDLTVLLDAYPNGHSKEPAHEKIMEYKHQVIRNYGGDWERFFTEFRDENHQKLNQIATQNKSLYQQNLELQETLGFVRNEMEVMQKARIQNERRKDKRRNARKLTIRDSVAPNEFQFILNPIGSTGFVPARKRTALILLYYTGPRVSNLLVLTINHIKDLLDKGKTCVPLNKGGDPRRTLALSPYGKKLFNQHLPDLTWLMADKEGNQPLFTTQIQLDKPINRSSFDNELNNVLKRASLELHKHIRTHSFRATIITELLETTPIQVVKDIIGHRIIKTTVQYNRNKVTEDQLREVLNNIDETRRGALLTGPAS